ncbi:MAG TPA: dephospho-CoA kinase, partial [Vicinamibacterales bacterium]|nr:dephospho-CoA kinase [Vicinamibacterales bacterium]
GSPGLAAVIERFGRGVLDATGALDRHKLAAIVFADEQARKTLESIIHPQVHRATDAWFASLDPARHPYAVADIPLLFEVNRDRDFDVVIVVAAEPETQIRRVMQRDSLSEPEARQRLAAQLPIDEKVQRADFVIRTDGPPQDTDRQVREVWERLRAPANS